MPIDLPTPSELAVIRTTDGAVQFQLTLDDVLWTARAASRESEREAPAIIWAFTQRAVLQMLQRRSDSYTGTVRSFSQPVNPIWARDGEMCRPGGKYHGTPYCSEAKLQARDWYTNATWAQLQAKHPSAVAVVLKWARGQLDNPVPRVTNFSDPPVAKSYLAKNPYSSLFFQGDNWYIIDPQPAKWPANYVQMVGADGRIASVTQMTPQNVFAAMWSGATSWWRIG